MNPDYSMMMEYMGQPRGRFVQQTSAAESPGFNLLEQDVDMGMKPETRSPAEHPGTQPRHVVRLIVSGLGAIGTSLLRLIIDHRDRLEVSHGVELRVVGAVDSSGAITHPDGIDILRLLSLKEAGKKATDLPNANVVGATVADILAVDDDIDILVEAGPGDLDTGGAGLRAVRAAQEHGVAVVLANKAPLVLAWDELMSRDSPVRYSACVGGALPTITTLVATLRSARPEKIEAALNGTSNYILRLIEDGCEASVALAQAQARGVTEPDPSSDIDGWDLACKTILVANGVLGLDAKLADVEVTGISHLSRTDLLEASSRGRRVVSLGTITPRNDQPGSWEIRVGPVELARSHPLARMDPEELGVVVHTDVAGRLSAMSMESDAVPSAAAVLRDVIDLLPEALNGEASHQRLSARVDHESAEVADHG